MSSDKCFLVLIHAPLFMFVGPLALLISNKFTCFYCCVLNRSLHQILTKGAKVDLKPSEEVDPCKCVRTHLVRSNALTVARRSSGRTQAQSARFSRVNPSRPWRLFAVDHIACLRPQITSAFERTTCVRTQARDLSAHPAL
jgi:hypothetical protein